MVSIASLLFASLLFSAQGPAEAGAPERAPYRLELVWIADAPPGRNEYVFVVGGVGFRTVAGLERFVEGLPKGSVLEWAPGCERFGDEPLLDSPRELEAFKAFCEKHGVRLVMIPAG